MDVEQNTQSGPNGFTQPITHNVFLTPPNRRLVTVPFSPPSQEAFVEPVSPSFPESSDSHISPTSSRMSTAAAEYFIPARDVVADSTPQLLPKAQRPVTLSSLPGYRYLGVQTTPQPPASSLQTSDVISSDVLLDETKSPPIERRRLSHPACLIPGSSSYHPHVSSSPAFPAKFSIEGVSARLSPAIITRQPQHPILPLPPISSPSSPVIDARRRRSQSLRSVPALPMEGSEDLEPAENDNAMLDDLEEEEEDTADEDEEEGEETAEHEHPDTSEDGESISNSPRPSISHHSRPTNLPSIEITPLDLSFLDGNKSGTPRRDEKTPDSRKPDYFTPKLCEPGSSHTPLLSPQFPAAWTSARTSPVLPSPTSPSILAASWATSAPRVMPTPSTPTVGTRTNMYRQSSCSMIDMSEILRKEQRTPDVPTKPPQSPVRSPAPETDVVAVALTPKESAIKLGAPLRRQFSMPTFGPSSAPPPYPQFTFGERGPAIQPRDEEGREHLPSYTNDIYLRAIMPRKMEFIAPGVQARDRKWRRILCVLEGTAFRVYKCPSTATGKGLLGNLWEKTVGVGDISRPPTQAQLTAIASDLNKERQRNARLAKLENGDVTPVPSPPSPSPGVLSQTETEQEAQSTSSTPPRSRLLPPNLRRKNRTANDGSSISRLDRRSVASLRQQGSDSGSSHATSHWQSASASPPTSSRITELASLSPSPRSLRPPREKRQHLWVNDISVPVPQPQDLLHSYALHNAESGLGSDYVKRRNVIRIRMEGQQFLLQARDVASVVDWIEVRLSVPLTNGCA
jgi:hypothetical protein